MSSVEMDRVHARDVFDRCRNSFYTSGFKLELGHPPWHPLLFSTRYFIVLNIVKH